jgi:hypothetical protein
MNGDPAFLEMIVSLRQVMEDRSEHLLCFQKHGVQLEGWLKGELLHFMDHYKTTTKMANFTREEPFGKGRRKVDFCLEFPAEKGSHIVWLETKHWLIGYQKGCKYEAPFYFLDSSSTGIFQDVRKLVNTPDSDKYLLILTTKNPGQALWFKGVKEFNQKFGPLGIKTLTYPDDFPDYYFLGLLKLCS